MANYITCFFQVIGSYDNPRNMDKNARFGFTEEDQVNPIFGYSMNDVENAFQSPRIIDRNALHGTDIGTTEPDVSRMIAESHNNPFIIDEEDVNTPEWDDIFHILEYVVSHQSTANIFVDVYGSQAEEAIRNNSSLYYAPNYNPNTLHITMSDIFPDRVKKISFVSTLNGTSVNVTAYMTPDDLIESYQDKSEVYEYIDTDNIEGISPTEMQTQILNKILVIQNEHNFNRYDVVNVLFKDDEGVETTKYFYVFTLFNTEKIMNHMFLVNKIKTYLILKHSADYTYLKSHYPILFKDVTVTLIPLINNHNKPYGNSTSIIDLEMVQNELMDRGFEFNPGVENSTYKTSEIFILYGTTDRMEHNYTLVNPILAIEEDASSDIRPISHRYPNLIPKIPNSQFSSDINMFHYLVSLSQNVISGIVSLNKNDSMIDGVPPEAQFTIHWKEVDVRSEIDYVSFVAKGVLYEVWPPKSFYNNE